MQNYIVVIEHCTDALGNHFLKLYYGLDIENIYPAYEIEKDSELEELAITVSQFLPQENIYDFMLFKNSNNNKVLNGQRTSLNDFCLGTCSCTENSCSLAYESLVNVLNRLQIYIYFLENGHLTDISRRVIIDQSKEKISYDEINNLDCDSYYKGY